MNDIKKLFEERGKLDHELKAMHSKAESEGRDFNAEERQKWDELCSRDAGLKGRIDRAEMLAKREKEMSEVRDYGTSEHAPASAAGSQKREKISKEERALAVEAWARCQKGRGLTARHKEALSKYRSQVDAKFNPRSNEIYIQLRGDRSFKELQRELRGIHPQYRANVNTTTAASLRPEGFVYSLERTLLTHGPMLTVADVLTTPTGNDLPWPTLDDDDNEGVLLAEETTIGTSVAPTLSKITLKAYKFSSRPIFASVESLQDSAFDLAAEFGADLGERLGRVINRKLTVGAGTTEPMGIVTASTLGKVATSNTTFTGDELMDLQHSVDPAYRTNAAWMLHDTTMAIIRKLKSTDSQYIFQPGLQLGVPDRMLGAVIHINNAMDAIGDADDTNDVAEKPVLYGDFSKYKARRVNEVQLVRLVERYADLGQEAFIAFHRVDGNLINTKAVKHLQMKTS